MKSTLYLIHGLRGSHYGFRFIARRLARDYNIINLDLPGTGETPELDAPGLLAHIEYLHRTISALPEKPVVVAHSMGTILASHYAEAYPEDTDRRLILISPIFRTPSRAHLDKTLYAALNLALAPFPEPTQKKILASRPISYAISHFLTTDRTKQKQIDAEHYKYSGKIASSRALLADAKISMTSTTIIPTSKTTLIVMGAKDRLVNARFVGDIARGSSITYQEIPATGHLINYERPAEVAAAVADFLATTSV